MTFKILMRAYPLLQQFLQLSGNAQQSYQLYKFLKNKVDNLRQISYNMRAIYFKKTFVKGETYGKYTKIFRIKLGIMFNFGYYPSYKHYLWNYY